MFIVVGVLSPKDSAFKQQSSLFGVCDKSGLQKKQTKKKQQLINGPGHQQISNSGLSQSQLVFPSSQ